MSGDTSTNKRTLESSDSAASLQLKRTCRYIAVDYNIIDIPDSPIPPQIQAFPHVLQRTTSYTLSEEEAIMWTDATVQTGWTRSRWDISVAHPLVVAAINGNFRAVMTLLHQLKHPNCDYLDSIGYQILKMAALSAARNGHRDIVESLLHWTEADGEIDKDSV